MAFEIHKQHKLADHLEAEAYEWVKHDIVVHYDLHLEKNEFGYDQDLIDVLNEEQVHEIEQYMDDHNTKVSEGGFDWMEPYTMTVLNTIVDRWYCEQENPDDDEGYEVSFDDGA